MKLKFLKQGVCALALASVIVCSVNVSVHAEPIELGGAVFELSQAPTGVYEVKDFFSDASSILLYSLKSGTGVWAPSYYDAYCTGLSLGYSDSTGIEYSEWSVYWSRQWLDVLDTNEQALAGSPNFVYRDVTYGISPGICNEQQYVIRDGYFECNDLLYTAVAYSDENQTVAGRFYFIIEREDGTIPWEAFTRMGATVTPIMSGSTESMEQIVQGESLNQTNVETTQTEQEMQTAEVVQSAITPTEGDLLYIVKEGDTLGSISANYYGNNSKGGAIHKYNQEVFDANHGKLVVGMQLVLPEKLGSKTRIAEPVANAGEVLYTVMNGDTLCGIAKNYYGTEAKIADIFARNSDRLSDASKLFPGQVIVLPEK